MVRSFLLQCILLALPIGAGVFLYAWWNRAYFPAPRLTPNIAVNEKVDRIKRQQMAGADVLALGSSMTLNNLASGPVLEHFGQVRYVNAGAWGVGAAELIQFGPPLIDRLKPDTVLVALSPLDFIKGSPFTATDSAAIVRHLDASSPFRSYLHDRQLAYYLRQMETNRIRFDDPTNYEYLGYDAAGAALLNVPPALRHAERYAEPPPMLEDLKEDRFASFERFARHLQDRGIPMVVLSSPFREGLTDPSVEAMLEAYHVRLRGLLGPMGHVVLDAGEQRWPDSLYADASHFNKDGAELFTAHCLRKLSLLKAGELSSRPAGN